MKAAFPKVRFLDLTFDLASEDAALTAVREAAGSDAFCFVVTPNVDHVVRLHRDDAMRPALREAVGAAWLTLCDSRILALLARRSGVALSLVPGSDLTARLLSDGRFEGLRCHVVGGTPRTMVELRRRYDRLSWSQYVPSFGVLHDAGAQQAIVDSIIASRADVIFMAIGFPQSEVVCAQVLATGAARGVALCIGASLEFVTGEKTRAPLAFQRLKLEWLFRLLSEPRRLWRRYLIEGPKIFALWMQDRSRPPS